MGVKNLINNCIIPVIAVGALILALTRAPVTKVREIYKKQERLEEELMNINKYCRQEIESFSEAYKKISKELDSLYNRCDNLDQKIKILREDMDSRDATLATLYELWRKDQQKAYKELEEKIQQLRQYDQKLHNWLKGSKYYEKLKERK